LIFTHISQVSEVG